MGNMKKVFAVLLIGVFLVGGTAYAKGGPFTKFGRGLTNVLLSPGEIIYQPAKLAEDNNGVIAVVGGVPKGFAFIPVRIALGVYDLVTFFLPWPDHFGYWMEPETVIEGFSSLQPENKKTS